MGKPAMLDFVEGKVTIPYLLLHQRLENKKELEELYKKKLDDKQEKWIKDKMKETNALEDTISLAKNLGFEAINTVKDEENSETLVVIMKSMIEREF
ncbi:MAG: hypothetical protein CSA86_06230 [Arcobacter sp.]|nr:MAG: hypothetical protein CSA86_06230 [Arcobacter sp.]